MLEALIQIIRKTLSKEDEAITKFVISQGTIPVLLALCKNESEGILREIAWVFTNIAATAKENVEELKKNQVHKIMFSFLLRPGHSLHEIAYLNTLIYCSVYGVLAT